MDEIEITVNITELKRRLWKLLQIIIVALISYGAAYFIEGTIGLFILIVGVGFIKEG